MKTVINLESLTHSFLVPDELAGQLIELLSRCSIVKEPMAGNRFYEVTLDCNPKITLVNNSRVVWPDQEDR